MSGDWGHRPGGEWRKTGVDVEGKAGDGDLAEAGT